MPSYKVIKPGFFAGHYYDPEGKRPVLVTDDPFKKAEMPSWVIPMPKTSQVVTEKLTAQAASVEASIVSLTELIKEYEAALHDAEKELKGAKKEDKAKAELHVATIKEAIAKAEGRLKTLQEPEKSKEKQVNEANGESTSFLEKVTNTVTGKGSKVETL